MNKTIIFEGLDRCLKNTLIEKIKLFLPASHVLHYSKPPLCREVIDFQKDTFTQMFKIIGFNAYFLPEDKSCLILNRSHIGEAVYAPLYRNYDGNYVFDLEKKDEELLNNIFLITLYDSNIKKYKARDDGESLSKNEENKIKKEIDLFKKAVNKSLIPNKLSIDLSNYYFDENLSIINEDKITYEILKFIK